MLLCLYRILVSIIVTETVTIELEITMLCQIMNGKYVFVIQKHLYTSLTHCLTTHSFTLPHNHSLPPHLYSPIHSLTYLPIYSLTASLTHLIMYTRPLIHCLSHCLSHSLNTDGQLRIIDSLKLSVSERCSE